VRGAAVSVQTDVAARTTAGACRCGTAGLALELV